MQLIFEKESTIDITSNMSTLEDVLDKKIILNGIMENIAQDVNMGNKENINKSLNVIDEEYQNQKINSVSCIEEESLANSLVNINKLENEESEMEICNRNESVVKLPETIIQNENEEDLTVEKYIENNPELKIEPTEGNAEIHNHIIDEQQNVSVSMEKNCEDNEKEMPLNKIDNNPEEKLVKIEKKIDDILKKEVLNLDTPAQSEVEGNSEIQKCSTDDDCQLYIKNEALQDCTVKQEIEDIVNVVNIENKNDVLFNAPSLETEINVKVGKIINNKLTQLLQSTDEEVISEQKEDCDEEINNELSNVTQKITFEDIENDDMVRDISSDNENRLSTDTETVDVRDYENNDDSTDCKLEAMDVEFIEEGSDNNKNLHEGIDVDNEIHTKSSENVIENLDDSSSSNNAIDCDEVTEVIDKESTQDLITLNSKDEVMLIDEDKELGITDIVNNEQVQAENDYEKSSSRKSPICRLSNTLDILSDDDDDPSESSPEIDSSKELETDSTKLLETRKQAINIEDDDDIVVIDEDVGNKTETDSGKEESSRVDILPEKEQIDANMEVAENKSNFMESIELSSVKNSKESTSHIPSTVDEVIEAKNKSEINEQITETKESKEPILADGFLNTTKKRLADMTREELEEFCVLKIVESIVDRSNLSEIKLKLKTMAQSFEEYSKKTMLLYKQNRDLQVVLKSIQEEQKKAPNAITPLKITRSVGMQVLMIEKTIRKKGSGPTSQVNNKTRSPLNQGPRPQNSRSSANNNNRPVPRLIPASNTATAKGSTSQNSPNNIAKQVIPITNGVRTSLPAQKLPEKRPLNKSQSTDCVDLTDDEPPSKMVSRSPTTPVRLVPSQNLLAPQRAQFGQVVNSPRKVYIPISSPQGPNMRPGQTFMVKAAGPRARGPAPILPRMNQNQMRPNRAAQSQGNRHPAPLPDAMKQYQPPNWKALPPAPDLKLSKVENGIVISWKIEGYQEDSYEDIASYQLYAYQETSSPPSTALWKKIGDVKALPLPMACTLTQFMSGFKYYFAVRAVDVRSRLGPFSLPGSILLLNKM